MVEHNMVDLMAEDIDDLLERKLEQQQRVCSKRCGIFVQSNASDKLFAENRLKAHGQEIIAVIQVSLRDEKCSHKLSEPVK